MYLVLMAMGVMVIVMSQLNLPTNLLHKQTSMTLIHVGLNGVKALHLTKTEHRCTITEFRFL